MLGISEKIQRATFRMQRKLRDTTVDILSTKSTMSFLITVIKDKYQNKEYVLKDYKSVPVMIQFPDNEIPMSTFGSSVNSESSSVLHMYDILPIVAFFKFEDAVESGNILLYKMKLSDTEYQVLVLEVLQPIVKTNKVGVVYQEWVVAPATSHSALNTSEFQTILNEYKNLDQW